MDVKSLANNFARPDTLKSGSIWLPGRWKNSYWSIFGLKDAWFYLFLSWFRWQSHMSSDHLKCYLINHRYVQIFNSSEIIRSVVVLNLIMSMVEFFVMNMVRSMKLRSLISKDKGLYRSLQSRSNSRYIRALE